MPQPRRKHFPQSNFPIAANDNDVNVYAKGKVDINILTENDDSFYSSRTKKSGISFDSGLFIGTSKKTTTTTSNSTIANGSLVGSVNGNATIHSDDDLSITGSQIYSAQTTTLEGKNVTIQNAYDTNTTTTQTKYTQTGITIAVSNPVISGVQTAIDMGSLPDLLFQKIEDEKVAELVVLFGGNRVITDFSL